MLFEDLDILQFGNQTQLAGIVYSGENNVIFWLPGEEMPTNVLEGIKMDNDQWKVLLDQSDNSNVQVVVGNVKAILRKSLRAIDQNISWAVYDRDMYFCRYCGRRGIPLSVDHVDLWENGGATIMENLITACKRCNKMRGNMEYGVWLASPGYELLSEALLPEVKAANQAVLTTLPYLATLRVKVLKAR